MAAIVIAFYFFPPARAWLEELAVAKRDGGYIFTVCATVFAGAILPEFLKVLTFQAGKVCRENFREMLFLAIFWGCDGIIVDLFYQLQAGWFGAQVDVPTVLKKVLVDQFLFNPIYAAPVGLFFYEWKNQRYATRGLSRAWTWTFYKNKTIPALFATWVVWIPVTAAIYALPPLLQIPIFALALTFWVLMFGFITKQ